MSKMSDYLEKKIIDLTLRGVAYSPPSTVYIALFTSDPTDAKSGTEVSGGGYVRKAATFSDPGTTSGVTSNSNKIEFPVATGSWGTVTHIGIMDALSGGNLLYYGQLGASRTISVDNQLVFNIGQITVTLA